MNTEQFIKDAIAGGWQVEGAWPARPEEGIVYQDIIHWFDGVTNTLRVALLDPLAWQAVGKTRDWFPEGSMGDLTGENLSWFRRWHRFVDHLADGLSIEDALTKIS